MILEGVLAAFTLWDLLSGRRSQPQQPAAAPMAAIPQSPPSAVGFRPDQIARFTFREPSRALVFAPQLAEPLLRELDRHSVVELQMPAGMRAWQICPLSPELPRASIVVRQALAQGRAVAATVTLMALPNAPVPVALIAGPSDTIDAIAATSDYAVLARPAQVASKEPAPVVAGPPVKPLAPEPPPVADAPAPSPSEPPPVAGPKPKRKATKRRQAIVKPAGSDKSVNGVGSHAVPPSAPEVLSS